MSDYSDDSDDFSDSEGEYSGVDDPPFRVVNSDDEENADDGSGEHSLNRAQREELAQLTAAYLKDAKAEFQRRLILANANKDNATTTAASKKKQKLHLMDRPMDFGLSLMTAAAAANDVAFMQSLLDAGASISQVRPVDEHGPLMCALMSGATESIAWLLDRGVSADQNDDPADAPPLWHAIDRDYEDVALLLVERGANLTRIVDPTLNVLALAVSRKMVRLARRIAEMAPFLIAQQMDWNCDLLVGSCANSAFLPLTQHILANFSPDLSACASGTSYSALYMACQDGSLPHVDLLLEHGAPVNQGTSRGTALHAAANGGHLAIVERLLAHGAAVEPAKRWSSYTPLMLAVRNGYVAVARRFVEAGADTKVLARTGDTLLHLATCSGNADTVRLVLPFCNIDQVDHTGTTATLWACNEESSAFDEVLDVLLAAGAKVDTLDDEAWSPFTALAANGRFDAVKRLVEHGAVSVHFETNGTNLAYYAAECGHVKMLRWLLEKGVEFDMASTAGTAQVGETPLFVAAEAGHVEALRLLADVGANMHHTTPTGDTPLRVAARQGHGDCVRFLLRRGVKPTRADLEQCVAHAEHPGALIELLAHGCTVDSALFALLPKGLADHPLMTLGKNTPKFVVLWQAGASLNNVSLTPLATALARIAGALPAVQCVRGERCHDESERHEQLFYHERRHDREKRLASVMAEFVVSLAQRGLSLVDDRAVQVLFGLQPLDLPALVSTTIVDCACPLATMLPMHLKWRLVTLIKHFKSKSTTEK